MILPQEQLLVLLHDARPHVHHGDEEVEHDDDDDEAVASPEEEEEVARGAVFADQDALLGAAGVE